MVSKQTVQDYDYLGTTHLEQLLQTTPFQTYVYSYPHKTTYRPLNPPVPLKTLWAAEDRQTLFLYIHIPFCEMRCGFCNLFTTVEAEGPLIQAYLETLQRQAVQTAGLLGQATFARLAIGGGTPTQLSASSLEKVFNIAEVIMGADLPRIPVSVEVSPETAKTDKLQLLRDRGVDRLSLGVQSFMDAEVIGVYRRQLAAQVENTLVTIRELGFPTLNLDLMYGLPGQTVESWLGSIQTALRFAPEEIYLYPLYTRPITRLGTSAQAWDDVRLACYREGRALLLAEGYRQVSLRMFRAGYAPALAEPVYHCQEAGMVGLGCGARSYTIGLHYSGAYAVGPKQVRQILRSFITASDEAFQVANYGFELDAEDRRRRYTILSLLSEEGLDLSAYSHRFNTEAFTDLPQLADLIPLGLATVEDVILRLTSTGIERSDTIGPWLFSAKVRHLMKGYGLQ